jgi:hypothetical protein
MKTHRGVGAYFYRSLPWKQMEVCCQIYALADLPKVKHLQYTLDRRLSAVMLRKISYPCRESNPVATLTDLSHLIQQLIWRFNSDVDEIKTSFHTFNPLAHILEIYFKRVIGD